MGKGELVIIGAGPAGLSLSHHYAGASRILEAGAEVGGLCRSIEFGGGVFDLGGHSFHSPHPPVTSLVADLMAGRWQAQRRDARVFFDGELIDYPFQAHLHQVRDPAVMAACQAGLPSAGSVVAADNFEDWILQRFGPGVARHFMLPYNRKLWARDLRRMSCDWVGERVAGSEGRPAPRQAPVRRPLQSDTEVGYPADGGFVEIFRALAERCGSIEFGRRVVEIDPGSKTLRTADGSLSSWRAIASTMPLPDLMRCVRGCPDDLIARVDQLEFVSLKLVLVLAAGSAGGAPQRVYVAGDDAPPHKVAFNHTSSPSLRSRPVQAIIGEISYSAEKLLAPEAELASRTIDWLVEARLLASRASVVETRFVDLAYGYPVYTHDRSAIVATARAWLAQFGIHTFGRFGAWDYINSDECIWQGMQLARALGATRSRRAVEPSLDGA